MAAKRRSAASPKAASPAPTALIMVATSASSASFSLARPGASMRPLPLARAPVDQRPRGDGIDAGAAAFGGKIGRRAVRVMRVLQRRLEHAHAELGPLIGAERARHQIRQHELSLAQLFDDARLHDISGRKRKTGLRMPRLYDLRVAPDQSSRCHNRGAGRRYLFFGINGGTHCPDFGLFNLEVGAVRRWWW